MNFASIQRFAPATSLATATPSPVGLVVTLVAGLVGCAPHHEPLADTAGATATTRPSDVSVADVGAAYHGYRLMTPEPVVVDAGLAMMCAPASQQRIEAARARSGPHFQTVVSVYMEPTAAAAFESHAESFPPGSIVVKRKNPNRSAQATSIVDERAMVASGVAVAGMIKRPSGFDPVAGDWQFFFYTDPSQPTPRGELQSCVDCHAAASQDYVYGDWSTRR